MRTFLFLFFILLLSSCAKNPTEKVDEAIDVALTHLSKGECADALEILQDAGYQDDNAIYLQVYASAYACQAGFDEITFVATDLASIVTTSANTIMKSIATMSLSTETSVDSSGYVALRNAINVLLDSTTGEPTQAARETKFGTRHGGDMGVQALILNVVNLGKFLNYFGNVDSSGTKGAGSGPNSCFINYNDPRVILGASTGACTVTNDGHPDLDQSTADGKRRICEGLVLMTNILDILNTLDFSGSSSLSTFSTIKAQVNSFESAVVAANLGALLDITSQSTCETYVAVPSQLLDVEYFYSLVFESGLQ